MSVAINKIPGVESLEVSLNRGMAAIQLKPGNTVRLEQVWEGVQGNGFTPKEARIRALGEVIVTGGKLQFKVLGVNQAYDLIVDPRAETRGGDIEKQVGKLLLIDGVIPPPQDKEGPKVIHLSGFQSAPEATGGERQ